MVCAGSTRPFQVGIFPIRKGILQEQEPLHINQGGEIGCEQLCRKEMCPVGAYAEDPAKVDQHTRLRISVREFLCN